MSWKLFDEIYCINLNTRDDRKESCEKLFDKCGIEAKFHRVDKHPNGGVEGCFESHIDIITEAYNKKYEYIVIFEDDIARTKYLNDEIIKRCYDWLQENKSAELFYLGTFVDIRNYRTTKVASRIIKLQSICTHAYIITRKGMKRYANMKYTGTAIDCVYLKSKYAYGTYPSLFIQSGSATDVGDKYPFLSKHKNLFFRPIEFYSYHINVPTRELWLLSLIIFGSLVLCIFLIPYHKILFFFVVLLILLVAYYGTF